MKYALVAVTVAALTAGVAGTSRGQEGSRPRDTQVTVPLRFEMFFGDATPRRARIGVVISMEPHTTDSLGALIDGVSPGGPADRAGIRSGDIISKVDKKTIGSTTERPGLRLSDFVRGLDPDDTITVEFYRGRSRRTVPVVTAPAVSVSVPGPADDSARNLIDLLASPLVDLSLAPLNPELGQYFGATEGVLVLSAPPGAKLGLKGGDVVLSADGRKISNPDRLLRLLRTRKQAMTLDVLRNHRHVSVAVPTDTTGR